MSKTAKTIIGIVAAAVAASLLIVWVVFFNTPALNPEGTGAQFGSADIRNSTSVSPEDEANAQLPVNQGDTSKQKIFKVAEGPIAGSVLIETTRPTSTIARYILQTNGHTFDLTLDSPGAVPKAVSNTTIPGIAKVLWGEMGRGALLQYVDDGAVKTAHITLPAPASTTPPVRIQFLPTGILSLAVSPDGKSAAYLLKTAAGSDLYTATANGSSPKKLTSFPLSQLLISWPAQDALLAQTPAAQGVLGVAFSVNARTGASAPLLFAEGLHAVADPAFTRVIYETAGASSRSTYAHSITTGLAKPLSYAPLPGQCVWSTLSPVVAYCPVALNPTGAGYSDEVHLGTASTQSALFKFNTELGRSERIATPGTTDGGVTSDIAEITVSQNEKYLLFISRGDRSLWAVRLGSN